MGARSSDIELADQLLISRASVTSTTATINTTCPTNVTTLTILTVNRTGTPRSISVDCNTTNRIGSLVPATNYSINKLFGMTTCLIQFFATNRSEWS